MIFSSMPFTSRIPEVEVKDFLDNPSLLSVSAFYRPVPQLHYVAGTLRLD